LLFQNLNALWSHTYLFSYYYKPLIFYINFFYLLNIYIGGEVKRMHEERITKLINGYQRRERKKDVQGKRGWKQYKQP
jgi:hypothetical protein